MLILLHYRRRKAKSEKKLSNYATPAQKRDSDLSEVNYSSLYLNEVRFDLLFAYTYAIFDINDVSGVKSVPGHRFP
jgi:hypothetical protein